MAMDPPEPADNLLDYHDDSGGPSQEDGNTVSATEHGNNAPKIAANGESNGAQSTTTNAITVTDDEQDESSLASPPGEEKQEEEKVDGSAADSQPVVEVQRQTFSQYQAAKKQKAKQVRMSSMMRTHAVLDEESPLVEPDGLGQGASWQQHALSEGSDSLAFSSLDSGIGSGIGMNSNIYSSAPNLPAEPRRDLTKQTAKRAPSSGSHSPKSMKTKHLMAKEAKHPPKKKPPPQLQQQSDKEINDAYQRLRQTTAPRRPVQSPMSGEDMKMGFATLISRNHTSGPEPPRMENDNNSSTSSDGSSGELTLLRDDSSDDGEETPRPRRLGGTAVPAAAAVRVQDDSALKAEYARMGFRTGRPKNRDGEGLPSQSEHGTSGTKVNPRRASLHPIIDEDPQSATQQLEAQLIRKSITSDNGVRAAANHGEENYEEGDPWPSALAYDPTVPGAHGISAPGSNNRRGSFERYDSYRTNQDHYLVSATVVEDDEEDRRLQLARDKSERFRLLESRQAELEQQIEEQKRLILAHHDELNRLRDSHGEIVEAEVIGKADVELDRKIRQRESIIAEKEAELQSMMGLPIPGFDVLRRYDHKKDKKKKGGLMKKLNPFRKNNTFETIRELDESSHSFRTSSSTHSRKPNSYLKSSHSDSPRASQGDVEGDSNDEDNLDKKEDDDGENGVPSREGLLLETKKRSERFIAPEKLPFEDYSISELKQMAEDNDVDISGCVERSQIVKKLQDAGVKSRKKGPLNKLFGKPKSKNSLGKSSSHSPKSSSNGTPKTGNRKYVDVPPDKIPSLLVNEKRESFYQPHQADVFEGISISQLKKIAREHHVDVSTCSDRRDLVNVLYAAGMRPPGQGAPPKDPFDDLSVSQLKKIARTNNVDISSCVEKGQIITALNIAGVRPPKKAPPSSWRGDVNFEAMSISDLKRMARDWHVDVSTCVEKKDIIAKLRNAGVGRGSPPYQKKAAPRLTRSELSDWRPTQLRMLAIQVGAPTSGSADPGVLLSKILHIANEEKKYLRALIRMIAPLGSANLAKLRGFAVEKRVDISGCVDKDEMLQRIVQKLIR